MSLADAIDAFAGRRDEITHRLTVTIDDLFSDSDLNWYDEEAVTDLACDAVEGVLAAQDETAALVDAFLSEVFGDVGVNAEPETNIPPLYRGGNPDSNPVRVWQRPSEQARYAESVGRDPLPAARNRAESLAQEDTQIAEREAYRAALLAAEAEVTGYRRVIHPEIARGGSCGLCIAAATRVYSASLLLPIHSGCNCTILPVVGDSDPGAQVNQDALGVLYSEAGGTSAADLKRVRVRTVSHRELGPVLVRSGDSYVTQDEADARRVRVKDQRFLRTELATLGRRLAIARREKDMPLIAIYRARMADIRSLLD